MQKYSRQREAVLRYLTGRTDHPTADAIYHALREEYPNISLGTVYRNLGVLEANGEIQKISGGDSSDHYDANTAPHLHVCCRRCRRVEDLSGGEQLPDLLEFLRSRYDGVIESYTFTIDGICSDCLNRESQ